MLASYEPYSEQEKEGAGISGGAKSGGAKKSMKGSPEMKAKMAKIRAMKKC
jgi:hypothetical protein